MNPELTDDEWQALAGISAENASPEDPRKNGPKVDYSRRLIEMGLVVILNNNKTITAAGRRVLSERPVPE